MRLKRTLAFVLTLAMLLGNVTPAFAAENFVSGNVMLTTDEDGNLQITEISDDGSAGQMTGEEENLNQNGGSAEDGTTSGNDPGGSEGESDVSGNDPSVSDNDAPLIEVGYKETPEGEETIEGFSSFGEAQEYIISDARENEREEYIIRLLGDVSLEEENGVLNYPDNITTARIRLELIGHTLDIKGDQMIKVNDLEAGIYEETENGEWVLRGCGTICLADGKTLSIYPRKLDDFTRVWMGNLNLEAPEGNVILGNDQTEKGEYVDLYNVNVDVNNMELYDGIHWEVAEEGSGEVSVGNLLKIKNDRSEYEARIRAKTVTKNLEIVKGSNVYVADFEVTEDAAVYGESGFRIESDGKAVFQNINVKEAENESFQFDLEQTVKLNSVDENGNAYADYKNADWDNLFSSGKEVTAEEIFAGAEVVDSLGLLTVKGKVSGTAIRLQKNYCWDLPAGEDWQRAFEVDFDIENGEDLAIINEQISEESFYIDVPGGYVHKYTDEQGIVRLKAIRAALTVWVEEMQWACDYPSLEAAAAGIPEDFGGFEGIYRFFFKENMTLKEDVTLPNCVKEAYFETDEFGIEENGEYIYIGRFQKILDLNGKTLTLPARLKLQAGLRVTSNATENGKTIPGKINIASDDYLALHVEEYETLVDDRGWDVEQRLPVLSDIEVSLGDRRAEFYSNSWTEEDEMLLHDLENTVLQAEELYLEGCYKLGKITANYVENQDIFFVNTLDMCGGTLVNRHRLVADKILNLGDFRNESSASLICNVLEQQDGKNTQFMWDSRIMINEKGTIHNLYTEYAMLGKGSAAELQINGGFSVNEEDQKLWIAITDSYAEIDGLRDDMTYYDPHCYHDNHDVVLKVPENNEKLFTTDNDGFPAGDIAVLPNEIYDVSGNHVGYNGITGAILHVEDGKNVVRAAGETVAVFAVSADGESESYLKAFTGWNEAVSYLKEVGNRNIKYVLHVSQPEIDFDGKFELPANAAQIKIQGDMDVPVVLKNTGDIKLATDFVFENITFEKEITIDANGKVLEFVGVRNPLLNEQGIESDAECTKIKAVKNTDTLRLEYSLIELTDENAATSVKELEMVSSTLETNGGITADTLLLKTREGNPSWLAAGGKVVLQDIVTYGMGNGLVYGELEINGTLKAYTEDGRRDDSSVYAIPQSRTVTIGEDTEATVNCYVISEERPEEEEYLEVKRNALSLYFYDGRAMTTETPLAIAANIAPSWFVYGRWTEAMGDTETVYIENATRKEKEVIKYGVQGSLDLNAVLYAQVYDTQMQDWIYGRVGDYIELQDAFDEIERIGDSEQWYWIVLKADDRSESDYDFPSQAGGVQIQGSGDTMVKISFRENMNIQCNMYFENVRLVSESAAGMLDIHDFEVALLDSDITDTMTVAGSGIGKGSSFIVAGNSDTEVTIAAIDEIDILSVVAADLVVKNEVAAGKLWLGQEAVFYGLDAIKLTDLECHGQGTIVTVPSGVQWKDGKITSMTPNLTVTGSFLAYDGSVTDGNETVNVSGTLNIRLGRILDDGKIGYLEGKDFSDKLVNSHKAVIAKAPNMGTDGLQFNGEAGKLYKKSGNVVYKDVKAAVELIYDNGLFDGEGNALVTKTGCETFADAVAEINSLKTKRDYSIRFLTSEISMATEFKMPNKNYVDTLIITSAKEDGSGSHDIYYLKDISLTGNTVFTMANLVQVSAVKENGKTVYKPVSGDKAVKIKTGGNDLTFAGNVYFNTPINLDGGSKGTLALEENTWVYTVYKDSAVPSYAAGCDSYIQGSVSKFALVSVNQSLYLDGWTANGKYTPAQLNVTGLNVISENEIYGDVTVGRDGSSGNNVKVNDLILNGANLYVYGDAEFKNVTFMGDAPELHVYGQKFNIKGILASTAVTEERIRNQETGEKILVGAKIVTTLNSKSEPVLNVSGTTVLGDIKDNRMIVRVVDADGKAVKLTESGSHLLNAKKAEEAAFLADSDCIKEGMREYNVEEPGTKGYFLKKNGTFIDVHYSDEIEAVLYRLGENEGQKPVLLHYYKTLEEAVAAIKKLKDKTAEYKIVLLKTVGSENSPLKMAVPDQAAKVIFAAAKPEYKLYNSSNITQKTDIVFEDITVISSGTWNAGKFALDLANADMTVKGKTTVANLTLANDAVLRTENTTVLTNILNYYSDVKDREGNKIISKPGSLTMKGYVDDVVDEESTEAAVPKLILDAAGAAEPIVKTGNKYLLSNTAKLAVLEKETMNTFDFFNGKKGNVNEMAVWTSKGIFLTPESYTNDVDVVKFSEDYELEYTTRCLDMTEASNYISKVGAKDSDYQIILENDIADTKVTDGDETSTWTLPGKDKAAGIHVIGDKPVKLTFKKNLKAVGLVVIENINLINDSFSISCDKNSDVKEGKETIPGMSELTLDNVKADGLKSITGNKSATDVQIAGSELNLSGGVTNVVRFTLENSKVTTNAKSAVQVLTLFGASSWDAMGTTTIGDVNVMEAVGTGTDGKEPGAYVSTYYKKGKPQLTVTGSVTGEILPITVYQSNGKDRIQVDNYKDTKLVLAKNESAEKFIAYPFAEYYEETIGADGEDENLEIINGYGIRPTAEIVGYKDKDGYVYNGVLGEKQVILSQRGNQQWSDSYAASYEEAIAMINQYGNKEAEYKITFIRGNDDKDENHIILENTLLLPKANKAKRLIINGGGRKMTYEGGISATCNLEFEDITFNEVKRGNPINSITLNCNKYNVIFGECISTVYDTGSLGEAYQLVFTSIKAPKGGIDLGNNMAYSLGEVNVGEMFVAGHAKLFVPENNVAVSDIIYMMDEVDLHIQSGKTITFNNIRAAFGEIQNASLQITTQYTEAETLEDSRTQLTIKGEADPSIRINITPLVPIEGQSSAGYQVPEGEVLQKLIVKSGEEPQPFQKVITAPKMASENVSLLDRGCHAIRHDGGIYFTYDNTMEVVGYEEVKADVNKDVNGEINEEGNDENVGDGNTENDSGLKEVFRASYLNWDMAVKEIDSLNRTDWIYDINLYYDLGSHNAPISSLSMPTKAKALAVCGSNEDIGILTTSSEISVQCPTEFRNITLCAVKETKDGYQSIPLTVDGGRFYMSLSNMHRGCDMEGMGWFDSEVKLTGQNTIEIFNDDSDFCDVVSQICNAGNVNLYPGSWGWCYYEIPGGIQNVEQLNIMPGVEVNAGDSEISVKDLYLGEATGSLERDDWGDAYQPRNDYGSRIQAKNITASGTTIMASADMKAGTREPGDGKITLNHVVFKDTHNHIEGKQDAEGNSLISIQGTTTTEDINPGWTAATIALCLSNSVKRYAQLSEGMTLMTAPNAITSLFRPNYSWDSEQNMGPEIVEFLPALDENGEQIVDAESGEVQGYDIYTYGLYKSGDDIKYGRLREIINNEVIERNEVCLWFGNDDPDTVSGNIPTMEYATFEEALATINRMPEYEEYTIELLRDVELGNENGDGKYNALTLPAKISGLNIRGWGRSLAFDGNISLKSDTTFEGINLIPMKTEKGVPAPTMTNITVGNYVLTVKDAMVGYWDGEPYNSEFIYCLNNITGSAKGRLIICENSYLSANNISGVAVEFAGNGEKLPDITGTDGLNEREARMGYLVVYGKLTTKELKFTDCAVVSLSLYGNLTTDAVYVVGANDLLIRKYPGSSIQIKGTTRTMEAGSKVTGSVFFDEVEKYSEETEEPEMERTDQITLAVYSENEREVPSGVKVITGKYLNPDDWYIETVWTDRSGEPQFNKRSLYLNGTDLYLGGLTKTEE